MAQQYIGTARWGTVTNQIYTASASTAITVGSGIYKVRIQCTSDAYVRTDSVTATSSNGVYMTAGQAEYVTVNPGQTITAVQVSAGGSIQVVECL